MSEVPENIKKIYEAKKVKLYALCLSYAGQAINIFRSRQGGGNQSYWDNQTNQALSRMFSNAFVDGDEIGWFLSHGVNYGVYLELANDRQNEAIRPIIQELLPQFKKDVEELF